jgi:NADPH-dependent 2,4-dienoyl-CoA reductase/sulfur reductase-like enzyme
MDADLDFNQRIKVDSRCRTEVKRVFAAGNCTAIEFFATMRRVSVNTNFRCRVRIGTLLTIKATPLPTICSRW